MSAPLTNRQKAYLAQMARRAWERSADADGLDADSFRHLEVAKACGKLGLRCCSQNDYGAVKARFLALLGREDAALRAELRQLSNPLRVIQWKIIRRCKDYGIPLSTAEGICRQMTRGRGLRQVEEERTLWNVFFKLRFYKPNTPH